MGGIDGPSRVDEVAGEAFAELRLGDRPSIDPLGRPSAVLEKLDLRCGARGGLRTGGFSADTSFSEGFLGLSP